MKITEFAGHPLNVFLFKVYISANNTILSECTSRDCDLNCDMGQVVDFAGCPVCKCVDPKPHYCLVCELTSYSRLS